MEQKRIWSERELFMAALVKSTRVARPSDAERQGFLDELERLRFTFCVWSPPP